MQLGIEFKGAVLDLRGLDALGIAEKDLIDFVTGLVRAVRVRRVARVLLDQAESWTRTPTILGNVKDPLYRRISRRWTDSGMQVLELWQKRPRPSRGPVVLPSDAAVVVVDVSRTDRALGEFEVRAVRGDRDVRERVVVAAENEGVGRLLAAATWLRGHAGRKVALPVTGSFGALVQPLTATRPSRHASMDFDDAVALLRDRWRWRYHDGWLTGHPVPREPWAVRILERGIVQPDH
ncbi:MAG: hypothetical protein KC613_04590 [Myxococcales bacterium]|nr:hypothetical protein [Myxococcales bacterium]